MSAEAESFFGWLDYDDRDAQRMREVFAAFDDKDTIDSLGLGVIRDSLSDQLFPGISTIQTRARYFLFVPWVCQLLEAERVAPSRFSERLRELEVALIESLRGVEGPNEGVIGYRARKRLTRLPSTVYWNGLKVFGIRLLPLTTSGYRGVAGRLGAILANADRDDDGDLVSAIRQMWDPGMPAGPAGFPGEPIWLTLSDEESEYLAGKIVTNCPQTMLGELARDLEVDRSASLPWDVVLQHAPSRLVDVLGHARNFSELMEGAQALYNLLLAVRAKRGLDRDTTDLQRVLHDELDEWAVLIHDRRSELTAWIAGEEFWLVVERMTRVPTPSRRFVLSWARLALAAPNAIVSSPEAERLVVEREFRLKGKLARLSEPRALENWKGEPFSLGRMKFRWPNARRILDDLQYHEGA